VNRATQNALAGLLVKTALIVFAVYVAVATDAFPGATTLARAGLVALAFGLVFVVGEVERLRAQTRAIATLLGALGGAAPRDDRAAVDVLVAALSSTDAAVREKAHRNLQRITGEDLPPDPEAWRSWWAGARDGFVSKLRRPH
jgi:hypothetical protein